MKTDEQRRKKKVLSKFTILYWAAFIAVLGHRCPAGHGLDTPQAQLSTKGEEGRVMRCGCSK